MFNDSSDAQPAARKPLSTRLRPQETPLPMPEAPEPEDSRIEDHAAVLAPVRPAAESDG